MHYTDFFLLQNLDPQIVLGMVLAGEWIVDGGIHRWEMGGFPDTGHFLVLAQEWHWRQLQRKEKKKTLVIKKIILHTHLVHIKGNG